MLVKKIASAALLALILAGCGTVPVTGRRTLSLVSDAEILNSSVSQYRSFIQKAPLSTNATTNKRVTDVGNRLVHATMQYLKDNNYNSLAEQMSWELNVVNSGAINAFCMPGGKIVVYTGILGLIGSGAEADAQLAAVVGHEIAHALAKHANERISNQMLMQLGGNILGSVVGNQSATLQAVIGQAYGLGTNMFVALPFGRKQELEADKIGLVLMAMAGYDPAQAINLWRKMAAKTGGSGQSEFFSTHPSDETRISEIQKFLPEAQKYYRGGNVVPTTSKATTSTTKSTGATTKPSSSQGFRYETVTRP